MKFLNQNRGLLTRILRLLGIGQIPEEPLDLIPTLIANSPDSYAEFQVQGEIIAIGATASTTFGTALDARKDCYISAVEISGTAKLGGGWGLYATINGANKLLCFIAGATTDLGAEKSATACFNFVVPKKIDLSTNNITLAVFGGGTICGAAIHGYQI